MPRRITDSIGSLQEFAHNGTGEEHILTGDDSIRTRANQMCRPVLSVKPLHKGASVQECSDEN